MPSRSPSDRSVRLHRLSNVLRRFGLVDRYGIGDKILATPKSDVATLKKLLGPLRDDLPPGLTAAFLAESIHAALAEASPDAAMWQSKFSGVTPRFRSIATGSKCAHEYHMHVFELLVAILDGLLDNGRIEQEINTGIQRVDIMFDNCGGGVFSQASPDGAPCNYVPFECKNYTEDLNTPEYDQLSGRLNPDIGNIGVLVFRSIANWGRANLHCQAKYKDKKILLLFDDNDLVQMYGFRQAGDVPGVEQIIRDRVRAVRLNTAPK